MNSDPDPRSGETLVGRIGRPHGVKGEVTVLSETDDPERFVPGAVLLGDTGESLTITSVKPYRDAGYVVGFEGVADREAAEALRGTELTILTGQRRVLPPGEWWPDELVGLIAIDPDGAVLGEITDVEVGPQDRLVVTTPGGAVVQVPFADDLVDDPAADGTIVIRPPEGLFGD